MLRLLIPTLIAIGAMITLIPREAEAPVSVSVAPTTEPTPAPPKATAGNGLAGTTLARAADGHFYADVQINGATVHALIDSGASAVVLTRADAQAAGLSAVQGDFTATAHSAGGPIKLKPVTIDRIALGPVSATHIEGAVAQDQLPITLLGQTFLSRISRVEITGDEMRLR